MNVFQEFCIYCKYKSSSRSLTSCWRQRRTAWTVSSEGKKRLLSHILHWALSSTSKENIFKPYVYISFISSLRHWQERWCKVDRNSKKSCRIQHFSLMLNRQNHSANEQKSFSIKVQSLICKILPVNKGNKMSLTSHKEQESWFSLSWTFSHCYLMQLHT